MKKSMKKVMDKALKQAQKQLSPDKDYKGVSVLVRDKPIEGVYNKKPIRIKRVVH
jgi:hypothetical protein